MPETAGTLDAGMVIALGATVLTLVLLTASAVIGAVVLRPRVRLRRRMAGLGLIPAKASGRNPAGVNPRQKRIQEKLQELQDKRKARRRRNQIRADLIQAGLDANVRTYLLTSAVVGLVATALMIMFGLPVLAAIPGGLAAALGLPKLALRMMARRRQKKFTGEFANALDVIIRGIRSGLPVSECLSIIGRESPEPVGQEFRMLVEGQKIGLALDELLRRGLERMPTAEYKFFAIVLQIQQQTGGNLADTLDNLSGVLRERKKMKDKVVALSSEAKSSAMIIGSLPFFVMGMISLINPEYMGLLFNTSGGNMVLAGGASWMLLGVLVMRKMINFKM